MNSLLFFQIRTIKEYCKELWSWKEIQQYSIKTGNTVRSVAIRVNNLNPTKIA